MKTIPPCSRAFTLLELCIVLLLMALLAGISMPAVNSALTEQALRSDTRQLSLLVKEAMTKCQEQKSDYVMHLDGHCITLTPVAPVTADEKAGRFAESSDITIDNSIFASDPERPGEWNSVSLASWTFEPDALCPMPRVRLQRGESHIEMSFDALTGDVQDETTDIQ